MIISEPWGEDSELHVTGGIFVQNGARSISIKHETTWLSMTSAQARELAQMLTDTADHLDNSLILLPANPKDAS